MKSKNILTLITYIFLICIGLFLTFPFIWMIITSLKTNTELYSADFSFFVKDVVFDSYKKVLSLPEFRNGIINSFIVATITSITSLIISALAAYAFSRFRFYGKNFLLSSFLSINMFPAVLLLIPLFTIMKILNLTNSIFSLILSYSTFTIPFSIWLLSSYLNEIPKSLDEAAMIDGCNRLEAFLKIILPLMQPGIVATGVYIFITSWNEFVFASMLTNSQTRTLPVVIQNFVGQFNIQWGLLTAGGVISIIPTLIIFSIMQKKLISGLTAGSVK